MEKFRILYVKKFTEGPSAGDISHIGGINAIGETWSISIDEAMEGINAGIWEFYLVENFEEIKVNICTQHDTDAFLSAKGHGYLHNLLEDLPECTLAFQF